MQNHRGLPKKLPARKNKAKIYSPSISPSKTNQSTRRSDQKHSTIPFITPQRGSSSSHSKHRIKSKQKPSLRPSLAQSPRHIPTIKKFDENIIEDRINIQKPRQNQFIQTVLGMMGNLAINNQNKSETHGLDNKNIIKKVQNHKDVLIENKNNQILINKNYNKTRNSWIIASTLGQSYQLVAAVSDGQLLQRCQTMLQNQNNCTKFFGDKANGMRMGYGIQYFSNKDKFMGGFKQDKAEGHGTFYLQDLGKRIMAIWQDNKIVLDNSYIIENI